MRLGQLPSGRPHALLDLEKEVGLYAGFAGIAAMLPEVSPRQLHGLELDAYAHELAQVAVWIAYIQWMTANGFQPRRDPVLQALDTIRLQDALLDRSDPAHPREAAWPEAEFVIGSPPFLGGNKIRRERGDEYITALFKTYEGHVPAFADLVCYFFEKARDDRREMGRACGAARHQLHPRRRQSPRAGAD